MFCSGSRVSIDPSLSRRCSTSAHRSDHLCYTHKFPQSRHQRRNSLSASVGAVFCADKWTMGTSLCVSLGWQECACGMAETEKLTGKLLCCHLLLSLIDKSVFHLSRCWSCDATSSSLGFSGSRSVCQPNLHVAPLLS